MSDFDFVTDRLAVGNVASRAVPGFVAVVSLLSIAPWDEYVDAPPVAGSITTRVDDLAGARRIRLYHPCPQQVPVLHIDINDGEGPGSPIGDGRDLVDYLDDVTAFIAAHIARGCVLVHCGAGKSRSVAVVVAYLCRYAGMSYAEALTLVKARRQGAAPCDAFAAAVKRWLRLDDLTTGARHG